MLGDAERALMRQRHQREGQLDTLFAQVHAFADGDDPSFTPAQLAMITADTLIVFGDRDPLYPVSWRSTCDRRFHGRGYGSCQTAGTVPCSVVPHRCSSRPPWRSSAGRIVNRRP